MALPNLGAMRAVADRLDQLGIPYAFVGGSIVNLLLDNPTVSPARPTDDVDVIIELVSSARYSDIEAKLRTIGFDHDMSEGAPKCRWVLGELLVDIMPTDGSTIGLNTAWFTEALATAAEVEFAHSRFRLISPTAFIALKYVAFLDRGKNDFYGSHDLEDLLAVVDGRAKFVADVDASQSGLRKYIVQSVQTLLASDDFMEALPGHLPAERASQERLPGLVEKLRQIAALPS
jgi:predicted nucleotidyltransferase